jgi:hypothetical protein
MSKIIPVPSSAVPVLGLLGATLVVLKLLGHITISWWWVLCPFWLGPAIVAAVLFGGGLLALLVWGIINLVSRLETRKARRTLRK